MNRISPVWDKCVNRRTNIKYWFLKAFFVVAAVWMFSLASSTTANAQTPGTGNTKPACPGTVTSAPTGTAETPIGPSAMGYYGLFGYLDGGNFALTNSINTLLLKMTGGSTTTPTDLAVNEPDQTQTTTQAGPCVAQMPATKPKQ